MERAARRHAAYESAGDSNQPDSQEIARLCEAIRDGWSEQERLKRLRWDWRPAEWVACEVDGAEWGVEVFDN